MDTTTPLPYSLSRSAVKAKTAGSTLPIQERLPDSLRNVLLSHPRKFANFRLLCRQLPHAIILEILDYFEFSVSNPRDCVGRFSNTSERRFVVVHRSVTVDIGLLQTVTPDQISLFEQGLIVIVLRDCRHAFLELDNDDEVTKQFFARCRRLRFLEKVQKMGVHTSCQISPIDTIVPPQFLSRVCNVILASGGNSMRNAFLPQAEAAVSALNNLPNFKHLTLYLFQNAFDSSQSVLGPVLQRLHRFEVIADIELQTLQFLCTNLGPHLRSLTMDNPSTLDVCTVTSQTLYYYNMDLRKGNLEFSSVPRQVTRLELTDMMLQTLCGIEQLAHLTELEIAQTEVNSIESIISITECKKLESLTLRLILNQPPQYAPVFLELDRRGQLKRITLDVSYVNSETTKNSLRSFGLIHDSIPQGVYTSALESLGVNCSNVDEALALDVLETVLSRFGNTLQNLSIYEDGYSFFCPELGQYLIKEGYLLCMDCMD